VHDIIDLEGRGVPGVYVASTEFVDAADTQAAALGYDPEGVFVPHPIQDRTDEEIKTIAAEAVEPLLKAICSG
jgi:hypothetical protein